MSKATLQANPNSGHASEPDAPREVAWRERARRSWRHFEAQVRPFLPAVSLGWLFTWLAIYVAILVLGFFFPGSTLLTFVKLLGIFLCLVFAVINFRSDLLLLAALLFTVCADVLLALNNLSTSGVMVFAMAQLAHFVRLSHNGRHVKRYFYFALVVLSATILLPPDLKILVYAGVYAVTLLCNVALSFRWAKAQPSLHSLAALAGFALFAACDIHVAVSYATVIGILPLELKPFADYMAWFFYYPSQLCISASSRQQSQK